MSRNVQVKYKIVHLRSSFFIRAKMSGVRNDHSSDLESIWLVLYHPVFVYIINLGTDYTD